MFFFEIIARFNFRVAIDEDFDKASDNEFDFFTVELAAYPDDKAIKFFHVWHAPFVERIMQ